MTTIDVVGIDPGIVDTGIVRMSFDVSAHEVEVGYTVSSNFDMQITPFEIRDWIRSETGVKADKPHVFIERYQPRPGMPTNSRMTDIEHALTRAMPSAQRLLNTGVKRVVTINLMQLLQVWSFPRSTHHQDLRSAARIGLLGMLKDQELNTVLADIVKDSLGPKPVWSVRVKP